MALIRLTSVRSGKKHLFDTHGLWVSPLAAGGSYLEAGNLCVEATESTEEVARLWEAAEGKALEMLYQLNETLGMKG